MDKIMSARVNEAVIKRIGLLARRLGTSKKAVIERAIEELSHRVEEELEQDVLDHTHGVWKRDETVEETVERAKEVFRDSIERHHR